MEKSFPRPILISITILLFVIFAGWWSFLILSRKLYEPGGILWMNAFQLMALWGSILGFIIARTQGWFKNSFAQTFTLLSTGLLFQFIGGAIWGVYNVILKIEIPYPSLADVGFFGSIFLYIGGIILLGKSTGIKFSFEYLKSKIQILIIPLVLLVFASLTFLADYNFTESSTFRIFLDFAYPVLEACYVAIGIYVYEYTKDTRDRVVSNKVLLIVVALIVQCLAEYNFFFQAKYGTWTNGGYGDLIYFSAQLLMVFGLINLGDLFNKENKLVIKKAFLYAVAVGVLSWVIFAITLTNDWFLSSASWARAWMIPVTVSGISIFIFYIIWRQLESSDRARYEFVTIATHKFRTPLTRIKHGIDLLLDEANQVTDKNINSEEYIRNRELLERLKKDNLELIELTSLMLKSGKTNKVSSHELANVDLAETFFKVVNANRHNFESKNINIRSGKLNAPIIKADPRRIKSLLEILIDNTLHYTYEDGEVGISATCKEGENQVKCVVSNTGIPILSNDKKKIFESFYRTDEAKKMNTEGTGLGLFLAKKIVEMHGGKIWVEDLTDQEGVRFIFTIPV